MRQVIDRYKQWLEAQMGIPVSAVILKFDLYLTQAAIAPIVDCSGDGACNADLVNANAIG